MLNNDQSISAMGDCAVFTNDVFGLPVRLESIQAATGHVKSMDSRVVKSNFIPYVAVPWFWSDLSDWKLQIVSLAAPQDDSVVRDDGAVLRFSGSTLSAVETINNARTPMLARMIPARALVTREEPPAVNDDIAAL